MDKGTAWEKERMGKGRRGGLTLKSGSDHTGGAQPGRPRQAREATDAEGGRVLVLLPGFIPTTSLETTHRDAFSVRTADSPPGQGSTEPTGPELFLDDAST
jgi:hypothetical protein